MHKLCRNRTNKQRNSWFLLSFLFDFFLFHLRCKFSFIKCIKKTLLSSSLCGWNNFFFSKIKKFSHISCTEKIAFWRHSSAVCTRRVHTHTHKYIYYTCNQLNKISSGFGFHFITNDNFGFFLTFGKLQRI